MPKRILQHLRNIPHISQDQLNEMCGVDAHYTSRAEHHGDHLGTGQLERIAKTLGWKGDPALLLKFTDEVPGFEDLVDWDRMEELCQMQARKLEAARRRGPKERRDRKERKAQKERKAAGMCAGCPGAMAMADGAEAML